VRIFMNSTDTENGRTEKPVLVEACRVSKTYFNNWGDVQALQDVSFCCPAGAFISIVGASGCGKTTLLRIIAGLESPSAGEIFFQGHLIRGPGYDRAVVFQDPRLFPWLTVEQNTAFGIRGLKSKAEVKEITEGTLELVGLKAFRRAYPSELSGGMAQRVAIARALAFKPQALLLDEPFSALDVQTRARMQVELLELWQKTSKTIILVTHDIEEAVLLSQEIIIMSPAPGTVKKVLKIPLNYPRDRDGREFVRLKKYIQENILTR
jgi:NitT/TauT family transport system ATP-binding protein